MPDDMTLEEFEQTTTTKATVKPEEFKLEAEGLPESIKGKTAAEVASEMESLKKAFKASEEMRQTMSAAIQARPADPPPAPPAPREDAPKWPTREELAEMLRDPEKAVDAVEIMNQMALANAGQILEKRFGPLTQGVVNAAKTTAQQKYGLEFELFGKEIEAFVASIPNKDAFSTDQGWDDAVSYIRGKSGNLEKFFDARQKKQEDKARSEARATQEASSGFSATGAGVGESRQRGGKVLSAEQLEICRIAGWNPDEYIKFMD